MPIEIHGKIYKQVVERVDEFRKEHGLDYSIETELIHNDKNVIMKAAIRDKEGFTVSTGYAEEVRGAGSINKKSALENCETSAIGRALAAFGYAGSEYASAQEMVEVYVKETKEKAVAFYSNMSNTIRENFDSIVAIKQAIKDDDITYAQECYAELSKDEQAAVWVAPSKGGIFTTEERKLIKEGKSE